MVCVYFQFGRNKSNIQPTRIEVLPKEKIVAAVIFFYLKMSLKLVKNLKIEAFF
jgi:hypothetical protein